MEVAIITSYKKAIKTAEKQKQLGKKVCLATGCYDAIHIGHIQLFRFAKKHCDFLIVGIENDETIRLSKGDNRPIFKFEDRSRVLSELISIDLIFKIEETYNFGNKNSSDVCEDITNKINPDYLVTNPYADRFWKQKQERALKIGAKLLLDKRKDLNSTTSIEQKIKSEL
jgi:D-beta-D-heptose 7-phosphate kinase/D-beta-D-heptose 1-phosphate adenosyltransferase